MNKMVVSPSAQGPLNSSSRALEGDFSFPKLTPGFERCCRGVWQVRSTPAPFISCFYRLRSNLLPTLIAPNSQDPHLSVSRRCSLSRGPAVPLWPCTRCCISEALIRPAYLPLVAQQQFLTPGHPWEVFHALSDLLSGLLSRRFCRADRTGLVILHGGRGGEPRSQSGRHRASPRFVDK